MSDSLEHHLKQCARSEERPYSFTLDLQDVKKPVQCYLWQPSPLQGKPNSSKSDKIHLCIYTHGAGGTCTSTGSDWLCTGLSQAEGHDDINSVTVLGFDGPMHLKTRTATFNALINWASTSSLVKHISLAGRSMGCRAAVLALTESLPNEKLSQKMVLQSYPLKGAGKGTKDDERKQILVDLPSTASVLFQSGDHDDMCSLDELNVLRTESISATTSLVHISGADHGLQLVAGVAGRGQKAQATQQLGFKAGRIAGEWLLSSEIANNQGTLGIIDSGETELSESDLIAWSGFERDLSVASKKPTGRTPTKAKSTAKRRSSPTEADQNAESTKPTPSKSTRKTRKRQKL